MIRGKADLLVIEDKASLRAMLDRLLRPHHRVETAADGREGLQRLSEREFDLVLSDVRLPDTNGREILAYCREHRPDTEVILMTAYASVEAAVDAVRAGAHDYVAKPFEPDDLLLKIGRALEHRALVARARAAEAALQQREGLEEMLGTSPAMRRVAHLIERVAGLEVTILLTGESGTGKEVAARAIHRVGARRDRPFVAVNCGAIPGALLESELFGHKKGAFTGAHADREGLIANAGRGTLFLDEIGDLPIGLQVKLNRALEERRYRRVGETTERRVEARVIAATHRDLNALVEERTFREDLYFRLAVYPIELPPLRERGGDVLLLARHFLDAAAERFGRTIEGFTPDALRALAAYHWPGNVRELAHAVERAAILAEGSRVELHDLPSGCLAMPRNLPNAMRVEPTFVELDYREAMEQARARATRRYLDALLQAHRGNVTRAAAQAAVERESLYRLVRRVGLNASNYREDREA